MQDFAYLRRLVEERLGEARLQSTYRDLEAQFKLLRYAESEGRAALEDALRLVDAKNLELLAAKAELLAAKEDLAAATDEVLAAKEEARAAKEELVTAKEEAKRQVHLVAEERDHMNRAADAARTQLHALYTSTSWRLTGPLRRLVRMLRRTPLAPASMVTAAACSDQHHANTTTISAAAATQAGIAAKADDQYHVATATISARFGLDDLPPQPTPLHMLLGSGAILRRHFAAARPSPAPSAPAYYTIVTPYFAHLAFFGRCAESVARLMQEDLAAIATPRITWIVVNDDPGCSADSLRDLVPAAIREHVRILSEGRNDGIAAALNRGIEAAVDGWILLLDCDDMIEPQATQVLDAHIAAEPACRYFSSAMIDIDENDVEIRRRRRDAAPEALFEAAMVMGHLVAFRRDLFSELGGFDTRLSGVQDYHLALRAALREPIRQIPDHLYRYRWHPNSVSVGRALRQARLTDAARADLVRRCLGLAPRPPIVTAPLPDEPHGLCIIRTQGNRLDLLAQAVASVRHQPIPFTPCVVVHGDAARRDFVARRLQATTEAEPGPAPVVLEASQPGRRRGYPCNVGLDQLTGGRYDLLCFLDDDDHLLPGFAPRLVEALRAGNADFAYGQTNALSPRGEPVAQHQLMPAVGLFHGNFIPINAYVVRTEVVLAARARFDETLHYLEDWDFLLQLVAAGARGVPLFETVAEYRIIGDGNTDQKRDQAHFEHCQSTVRARGATAAARFPATVFWSDVLDFPSDRRPRLASQEIAHLEAARDLFAPVDAP